jgi:hypothetical protein
MGKASLRQSIKVLQLVDDTGWSADEINHRIVEHWGLLRDIAMALDDPQLSEEQVRAMHPLFYKKKATKPASPSKAIAAMYGYTVIDDVEPTLKRVNDLEIVACFCMAKQMIPGETIHRYAERIGANLGLADLKFVLDRRAKISVKMEPYRIFFSGTKLRGSCDEVVVAYLSWDIGGWRVGFLPLDGDKIDVVRLARCKSA